MIEEISDATIPVSKDSSFNISATSTQIKVRVAKISTACITIVPVMIISFLDDFILLSPYFLYAFLFSFIVTHHFHFDNDSSQKCYYLCQKIEDDSQKQSQAFVHPRFSI